MIAVLLAAWMAWRREFGPIEIGRLALFSLLAIFLNSPGAWTEVYAFGRTLSPLLLLLGMVGLSKRNWIYALPLALTVPRTAIQLAPQAEGVLRSKLFSGVSGFLRFRQRLARQHLRALGSLVNDRRDHRRGLHQIAGDGVIVGVHVGVVRDGRRSRADPG